MSTGTVKWFNATKCFGCIAPEDGHFTLDIDFENDFKSTIEDDLNEIAKNDDISKSIFLFHSPPYKCHLDKANLAGRMIDNIPLDDHVGSKAIKAFINDNQPFISLHGHIHETSIRTGHWYQRFNSTHAFTAAYRFPELAIVKFDLNDPSRAERMIL